MVEEDKIKTLSRFIEIIKEITDNKQNGNELFFRGHEDKDCEMIPTIYRSKGHTGKEYELFKEVLLEHPDEFRADTTTLEKLVRMRHYGLPTRLLDITANPLVALFFACTCNGECKAKDGEVVVLSMPVEHIKYYDSDSVSILSNLCKLKNEDINKLRENLALPKKDFNEEEEVKKLLHEIKKEKIHFESIIEPDVLNEIYCVKVIKNNPRIISQQGLFLIFGLPNLHEKRILSYKEKYKIIIDKNSKCSILKELKSINIARKSLFPEIESTVKELKKRVSHN